MAKIIEFKRRDSSLPHHRESDERTTYEKDNQEIFQDVYEDVSGEWQRYAIKNKLNEYMASVLPNYALSNNLANYISDLNVISEVEQKLNMKVAVFYPGCSNSNPYGWLAAFHYGDEIFSTPADMASEANARALNILLYLNFSFTMKSLGRD